MRTGRTAWNIGKDLALTAKDGIVALWSAGTAGKAAVIGGAVVVLGGLYWLFAGGGGGVSWLTGESSNSAAGNSQTCYYAIRVDGVGSGGNGILSVRSAAAVDGGALVVSNFRHGGIGNEKARITIIGGPYSVEEATRQIAELIENNSLRNPPLADGMVATVGGQTVTIDDWGAVNFGLLRELGK